MIGENGTPATPDWIAPNHCGNCLADANLCHELTRCDNEPCCAKCSHTRALPLLLWQGDNA